MEINKNIVVLILLVGFMLLEPLQMILSITLF